MKYHKNVLFTYRVFHSSNPIIIDYFFTLNGVKKFIKNLDIFKVEVFSCNGFWIHINESEL